MAVTNKKNRFHSKLKQCWYAPATVDEETGAVSYQKPVKIPLSVSISLSPQGDLIVTYADGQEVVLGRDNSGYDGDLEMLRVPESFETDCLGLTKNADGTIDEHIDDESKPFALLFEFMADARAIRHCLYYCFATKQTVEGGNSDKKEPTNEKISIKARPRPDGKIKTKTGDTTTDEVYNGWYTAVPDQVAGE